MEPVPMLKVEGLTKYFEARRQFPWEPLKRVHAVEDVSFELIKGETFGLVGESGCGKSTIGRLIVRLTRATSGRVLFNEVDILEGSSDSYRAYRQKVQMVFQDPYSSLDPRMNVEHIVGEGLDVHRLYGSKRERRERVIKVLAEVGLRGEQMSRFPHEFSGGQRQRVGIARALAVNPELVIADEPISALDVSIQAQVINLLEDLQERFSLTYIFISHDLRVMEHISTRIGVMYLGKIVELADSAELYSKPLHPYTGALLSAIPSLDPRQRRERMIVQGDPPSPLSPPAGCRFHTRCPRRFARCEQEEPVLTQVAPRHWVSCHLY